MRVKSGKEERDAVMSLLNKGHTFEDLLFALLDLSCYGQNADSVKQTRDMMKKANKILRGVKQLDYPFDPFCMG